MYNTIGQAACPEFGLKIVSKNQFYGGEISKLAKERVMGGVKRIENEKLTVQIIKQIQSLVDDGYFKVGDKLPPERVLAEKLGVSRPSLREALCTLETGGLIERKMGAGSYIIDISRNVFDKSMELLEQCSPVELMEIREIIEREVIKKVARNATQEDIDEIERSFKKMESAVREERDEREEDIDFHLSIAESVNNNLLRKLFEDIVALMHHSLWKRAMQKDGQFRDNPKENLKSHRRIMNAIKNHNEFRALEALEDTYQPIKKYLYEEENL